MLRITVTSHHTLENEKRQLRERKLFGAFQYFFEVIEVIAITALERTFKNLKEKGRLNGGIEGDALAFIVVGYEWKKNGRESFLGRGIMPVFCLFMQYFLVFSGKVSGEALIFFMGTLVGYVSAFL